MAKAKAAKTTKATKNTNPVDPASVKFLTLGNVKTVTVPLDDSVKFDRRLQHRGKLTNEDTVKEYAELQKNGTVFPPLRAIRQTKDDETGKSIDPIFWVYNGFQRGAAYKLNKLDTVEIEYQDGTFTDALFLSFSANSDNGLERGSDDKKRSVVALASDPAALELCKSKVAPNFSLHRSIAAACGCSPAWVVEGLKSLGLKIRGGDLVKIGNTTPEPKEDEVKPDAALNAPPIPVQTEPAKPVDPAAQKAANDAAFRTLQDKAFEERLEEAKFHTRRLGYIMSSMAIDPNHHKLVKDAMKRTGLSISDEFDVRAKKEGSDFAPYYEILELWPVTTKLGTLFLEIKNELRKLEIAQTATTSPEQATESESPEKPATEAAAGINGKLKKGRRGTPTA